MFNFHSCFSFCSHCEVFSWKHFKCLQTCLTWKRAVLTTSPSFLPKNIPAVSELTHTHTNMFMVACNSWWIHNFVKFCKNALTCNLARTNSDALFKQPGQKVWHISIQQHQYQPMMCSGTVFNVGHSFLAVLRAKCSYMYERDDSEILYTLWIAHVKRSENPSSCTKAEFAET